MYLLTELTITIALWKFYWESVVINESIKAYHYSTSDSSLDITVAIQDDLQSFALTTAIKHGGCTRLNSWPEIWVRFVWSIFFLGWSLVLPADIIRWVIPTRTCNRILNIFLEISHSLWANICGHDSNRVIAACVNNYLMLDVYHRNGTKMASKYSLKCNSTCTLPCSPSHSKLTWEPYYSTWL